MDSLRSAKTQNKLLYAVTGKTAAEILLETAALRAKNRYDITMKFWRENVDRILTFNEKPMTIL